MEESTNTNVLLHNNMVIFDLNIPEPRYVVLDTNYNLLKYFLDKKAPKKEIGKKEMDTPQKLDQIIDYQRRLITIDNQTFYSFANLQKQSIKSTQTSSGFMIVKHDGNETEDEMYSNSLENIHENISTLNYENHSFIDETFKGRIGSIRGSPPGSIFENSLFINTPMNASPLSLLSSVSYFNYYSCYNEKIQLLLNKIVHKIILLKDEITSILDKGLNDEITEILGSIKVENFITNTVRDVRGVRGGVLERSSNIQTLIHDIQEKEEGDNKKKLNELNEQFKILDKIKNILPFRDNFGTALFYISDGIYVIYTPETEGMSIAPDLEHYHDLSNIVENFLRVPKSDIIANVEHRGYIYFMYALLLMDKVHDCSPSREGMDTMSDANRISIYTYLYGKIISLLNNSLIFFKDENNIFSCIIKDYLDYFIELNKNNRFQSSYEDKLLKISLNHLNTIKVNYKEIDKRIKIEPFSFVDNSVPNIGNVLIEDSKKIINLGSIIDGGALLYGRSNPTTYYLDFPNNIQIKSDKDEEEAIDHHHLNMNISFIPDETPLSLKIKMGDGVVENEYNIDINKKIHNKNVLNREFISRFQDKNYIDFYEKTLCDFLQWFLLISVNETTKVYPSIENEENVNGNDNGRGAENLQPVKTLKRKEKRKQGKSKKNKREKKNINMESIKNDVIGSRIIVFHNDRPASLLQILFKGMIDSGNKFKNVNTVLYSPKKKIYSESIDEIFITESISELFVPTTFSSMEDEQLARGGFNKSKINKNSFRVKSFKNKRGGAVALSPLKGESALPPLKSNFLNGSYAYPISLVTPTGSPRISKLDPPSTPVKSLNYENNSNTQKLKGNLFKEQTMPEEKNMPKEQNMSEIVEGPGNYGINKNLDVNFYEDKVIVYEPIFDEVIERHMNDISNFEETDSLKLDDTNITELRKRINLEGVLSGFLLLDKEFDNNYDIGYTELFLQYFVFVKTFSKLNKNGHLFPEELHKKSIIMFINLLSNKYDFDIDTLFILQKYNQDINIENMKYHDEFIFEQYIDLLKYKDYIIFNDMENFKKYVINEDNLNKTIENVITNMREMYDKINIFQESLNNKWDPFKNEYLGQTIEYCRYKLKQIKNKKYIPQKLIDLNYIKDNYGIFSHQFLEYYRNLPPESEDKGIYLHEYISKCIEFYGVGHKYTLDILSEYNCSYSEPDSNLIPEHKMLIELKKIFDDLKLIKNKRTVHTCLHIPPLYSRLDKIYILPVDSPVDSIINEIFNFKEPIIKRSTLSGVVEKSRLKATATEYIPKTRKNNVAEFVHTSVMKPKTRKNNSNRA